MRILDCVRNLAGLSFLLGLSIGAVNPANAVAVNCPGTAVTTDREFKLDTTPGATCLAWAPGNISGNDDAVNNIPPGYKTLDKSDDALKYFGTLNELSITVNSGGLSGTFSFTPPSGYDHFVLALKSGEGRLDPDWAAFSLPAGVTSGSWSISGQQGLSHINLYGQVANVPGPIVGAGLPGLIAACGGLLALARRRKASAMMA